MMTGGTPTSIPNKQWLSNEIKENSHEQWGHTAWTYLALYNSTIGIDKKGEWNDVVESMQWVWQSELKQ